jgi:hypothetical protein
MSCCQSRRGGQCQRGASDALEAKCRTVGALTIREMGSNQVTTLIYQWPSQGPPWQHAFIVAKVVQFHLAE